MKVVSREDVRRTVADFVKKRKNTAEITVFTVLQTEGVWTVQGTCPIDMEGHPWTERFEVTLDQKLKIVSTDFSLVRALASSPRT